MRYINRRFTYLLTYYTEDIYVCLTERQAENYVHKVLKVSYKNIYET